MRRLESNRLHAAAADAEAPAGELLRWLVAGSLVGTIALASLACSTAAAVRVAASLPAESPIRVWCALSSLSFGPMAGAAVILRASVRTLRALGGPSFRTKVVASGLWLGSLLLLLAVVGNGMRASTHNAALAGVTFACVASVASLGLGLLCARFASVLGGLSSPLSRWTFALAAFAPVAAGLFRLTIRYVAVSGVPSAASGGDVGLFVLALTGAVLAPARGRIGTAIAGFAFATGVLVTGVWALKSKPLYDALVSQAPAFACVATLVPSS